MQRTVLSIFFCIIFALQEGHCLANELDNLLENMAKHSAKANTLQANFVQQKKLSFLQNPLLSEGHFFFSKGLEQTPSLLWEYTSPSPSGFLFQKNEGWIWLEQRAKLKKAQGHEGNVLNTMIKQMLLWFAFEPENLKEHYTMTLHKPENDLKTPCINLVPLSKSFYSSMQICVATDDYTIKSLQFHETQGDSTLLIFNDIQINKPYPNAFPDGTPFP